MEMKVINKQEVLGKNFKVYGTVENPYFLAKDVAEWIDYQKVSGKDSRNVSKMLLMVDEEEKRKGIYNVDTTYECDGNNVDTTSRARKTQESWFLTEDGLYEVLMQSRKPIAKQFKKEVKRILKQLRLTGASFVDGREEEAINNYFPSFSEEVKLAMVQDLRKQNQKLKQQIEKDKPKVEFAEAIQVSDTNLTMGQFAKNTALGRNDLFKFLRENKILFRDNGSNVPYQQYINQGYFKCTQSLNNGFINVVTRITPKGQEYLFNKFPELVRKDD